MRAEQLVNFPVMKKAPRHPGNRGFPDPLAVSGVDRSMEEERSHDPAGGEFRRSAVRFRGECYLRTNRLVSAEGPLVTCTDFTLTRFEGRPRQ